MVKDFKRVLSRLSILGKPIRATFSEIIIQLNPSLSYQNISSVSLFLNSSKETIERRLFQPLSSSNIMVYPKPIKINSYDMNSKLKISLKIKFSQEEGLSKKLSFRRLVSDAELNECDRLLVMEEKNTFSGVVSCKLHLDAASSSIEATHRISPVSGKLNSLSERKLSLQDDLLSSSGHKKKLQNHGEELNKILQRVIATEKLKAENLNKLRSLDTKESLIAQNNEELERLYENRSNWNIALSRLLAGSLSNTIISSEKNTERNVNRELDDSLSSIRKHSHICKTTIDSFVNLTQSAQIENERYEKLILNNGNKWSEYKKAMQENIYPQIIKTSEYFSNGTQPMLESIGLFSQSVGKLGDLIKKRDLLNISKKMAGLLDREVCLFDLSSKTRLEQEGMRTEQDIYCKSFDEECKNKRVSKALQVLTQRTNNQDCHVTRMLFIVIRGVKLLQTDLIVLRCHLAELSCVRNSLKVSMSRESIRMNK